MWEFSLNFKSENSLLAKHTFSQIKNISNGKGGVATLHEEKDFISILLAVEEEYMDEVQMNLSSIITQTICTNFKANFLDEFLSLPEHDKIGMTAFKKALLNFDKETDKFLVQKQLTFDKNLYLESFYQFRLTSLKAKWQELVALANENRVYLISNDAFLDLLKFLIDNLDVCEEEVNVIEDEQGYKIVLQDKIEDKYSGQIFNDEALVSSIIDLAPQKINFYCTKNSKTSDFLEKIFDERINICTGSGQVQSFKKL